MADELKPNQHYCYSANEEEFRYDSLGDLIDEMSGDPEGIVGRTYYRGIATKHAASYYFNVERLLEDMAESAYDVAGEFSEDFTDLSDEKQEELRKLVSAWVDANMPVTFWSVSKTETLVVTQEDIDG